MKILVYANALFTIATSVSILCLYLLLMGKRRK